MPSESTVFDFSSEHTANIMAQLRALNITLQRPIKIKTSTFTSKIKANAHNSNPAGTDIHVYLPNATIVSTVKNYADIDITHHSQFIEWIEEICNLLYTRISATSSTWFVNQLERHEVETLFSSPVKIADKGQKHLLRIEHEEDAISPLPMKANVRIELSHIKFTSSSFVLAFKLITMQPCTVSNVATDMIMSEGKPPVPTLKSEKEIYTTMFQEIKAKYLESKKEFQYLFFELNDSFQLVKEVSSPHEIAELIQELEEDDIVKGE